MINFEFVYFQRRRFCCCCGIRVCFFLALSSFLCDSISKNGRKILFHGFRNLFFGNFWYVVKQYRNLIISHAEKSRFNNDSFDSGVFDATRNDHGLRNPMRTIVKCKYFRIHISLHSVKHCCTLSMMIYVWSRHAMKPSGSRKVAALFHTQHAHFGAWRRLLYLSSVGTTRTCSSTWLKFLFE